MSHVSIIDSLRVLGAMGRVTGTTLYDIARGTLERTDIDERTHWFGHRVVDLLNVDLVAHGGERLSADAAYVYMSNHQSHLDIPILYATLPSHTIRMLAKQELFKIPLWGRGIKEAEFISVDRSNHARAVQSIERAKHLIRDGVSIWIAPEGTRSRTGKIGPMKKGGFHLAIDTQTPIVPVAIRGTIDILPRGGRVMQTGKRVEVTIGDPIPVENQPLEALMAKVSEFLKQNVER
jgi:1-acyl-sn-glycerol-3-phosphate acyltransferase